MGVFGIVQGGHLGNYENNYDNEKTSCIKSTSNGDFKYWWLNLLGD